jgi:16S rRNA processing protein RimM
VTGRARSSRSSSSRGLLAAVVGRAVGLRGEVEVGVVSDNPERLSPGSVLVASSRRLTVRSSRRHRDRTIVAFEEVTDRTDAESLQGAELSVEPGQERSLTDGEYWDHELVGCVVETRDGEAVGRVADVLHQASSEVLAVETPAGERLIPLVEAFVCSVEPGVRIVIDPIPGLID